MRGLAWVFLITALVLLMPSPAVAQSSMNSVCAPEVAYVAGANSGANPFKFCLYYDPIAASDVAVVPVVVSLTGPTTVVPVGTLAVSGETGCTTAGFGAIGAPTGNGVLATIFDDGATFTMTSEQCSAFVSISVAVGVVTVEIYEMILPVVIQTENVRVDVLQWGCAATLAAANAYNPDTRTCLTPAIQNMNLDYLCHSTGAGIATLLTATCTDPTINAAITGTLTATLAGTLALSGTVGLSQSGSWTFTLNGIPDTQQEIQAIADALAGGLGVSICPPADPCYHVLSGEVDAHLDGRINTDVNGTLALTGVTVNQTIDNQSISALFPDTLHLCGADPGDGSCPSVSASNVELGHWLPIVAILLVLLAGIYWSNPLLMTMGVLGLFVFFAAGFPIKELGWLAIIVLAILAPAIARFHGNWKRRQLGVAPI